MPPLKLLQKIKALSTDLNVLGRRHGVTSRGQANSGGTHIWDRLQLAALSHLSAVSRLLNGALAMGSQSVFPSRAMGGLGFHDQLCGHVAHV